jgi:hypothetical protein
MKNTLIYNLFFCKNTLQHFNVIKTFRSSYTERFNINGYEGFFMWHFNNFNNFNTTHLTLKKNNNILTEHVEYDINNILLKNIINIINFEEKNIISVNKSHISSKLIDILEEKNDNHIISCGCCKRPWL